MEQPRIANPATPTTLGTQKQNQKHTTQKHRKLKRLINMTPTSEPMWNFIYLNI